VFDLITLARMANDVYSPPNKSSQLGAWHVTDLLDLTTGGDLNKGNFRIRLYQRANAPISCISFRGTDNWQDLIVADVGAIGIALNALSLKLNDAIDFTATAARKFDVVWLTGHSLGGAYVQLVGAILSLPGVSFNAPGVLNLVDQMSKNYATKIAGSFGSAGLQILSRFVAPNLGNIFNYFVKARAGAGNDAFPPVANYRGSLDPVSLLGVHVGMPIRTVQVATWRPHPHSMEPLIAALERRGR
jgi:hypothetical protein